MSYSVIACVAVRKPIRTPAPGQYFAPAVSVLKPLCGVEAETYACLKSFCDQQYPRFQIIFGVSEATDPVTEIVEQLRREYPQRNIELLVDRRMHGSNRKVSNLMNMMTAVRHDVLVLSDSDIYVRHDYLARVVSPLVNGSVGVVTCIYQGFARRCFWSRLGAVFINDWFSPPVRVAALTGSRSFAFGATIAMRREVLTTIGGFKAIANHLADDYRLGELTRNSGLRTVLSEVVVETAVSETTLMQLVRHELRWLRTIRALNPHSFRFLFLTFSLPMAVLARLLIHFKMRARDPRLADLLMLPLRDLLSLSLWVWSFVTRRVQWRDAHFYVNRDGSARLVESV
jgi:ceramide glucosyltransferase